MDFNELVNKRQSVRKYSEQKVEKEKILKCIEAARLAPSACNSQPWKFIVVDDENLKNEVANATFDKLVTFNKFTTTADVMVVVVMEKANFTSKVGSRFTNTDYGYIDMGIAVEHFCLQATELGLGTCILGWSKEKEIKRILNIPKSKKVGMLISVGYPEDDKVRKKIRKSTEQMVCYNKYCK